MQRTVFPVARFVRAVGFAAKRMSRGVIKTANSPFPNRPPVTIDLPRTPMPSAVVKPVPGVCDMCGQENRPCPAGELLTCRRCGNYIKPAGEAQRWSDAPWVAVIVVLGLGGLSYLLPIVAWALEDQFRQ